MIDFTEFAEVGFFQSTEIVLASGVRVISPLFERDGSTFATLLSDDATFLSSPDLDVEGRFLRFSQELNSDNTIRFEFPNPIGQFGFGYLTGFNPEPDRNALFTFLDAEGEVVAAPVVPLTTLTRPGDGFQLLGGSIGIDLEGLTATTVTIDFDGPAQTFSSGATVIFDNLVFDTPQPGRGSETLPPLAFQEFEVSDTNSDPTPGGPTVIPTPSALAAGLGLMVAAASRRRRM